MLPIARRALLLALIASAPFVGAHAQRANVPQKSAALAGALSVITPGAGHVYVGRYFKGALWFVTAAAAWYSVLLTDEDYAWNSMYLVYGITAFDATTDAMAYNRSARERARLGMNLSPARVPTQPAAKITLVRFVF
jgi:TM2 domain-containing membrane protein YozV